MDPHGAQGSRSAAGGVQGKRRTGLFTLLFTDVVGSTQLKTALGDQAGVALIQSCNELVRQLLARFSETRQAPSGTNGNSWISQDYVQHKVVFSIAGPWPDQRNVDMSQQGIREARPTGQAGSNIVSIKALLIISHSSTVFCRSPGYQHRTARTVEYLSQPVGGVVKVSNATSITPENYSLDRMIPDPSEVQLPIAPIPPVRFQRREIRDAICQSGIALVNGHADWRAVKIDISVGVSRERGPGGRAGLQAGKN